MGLPARRSGSASAERVAPHRMKTHHADINYCPVRSASVPANDTHSRSWAELGNFAVDSALRSPSRPSPRRLRSSHAPARSVSAVRLRVLRPSTGKEPRSAIRSRRPGWCPSRFACGPGISSPQQPGRRATTSTSSARFMVGLAMPADVVQTSSKVANSRNSEGGAQALLQLDRCSNPTVASCYRRPTDQP